MDAATPAVHFQGEESMWLHHPFLFGFPQLGSNKDGCITATCSASPTWGGIKVAASPLPCRSSANGEESKWLDNRCHLGVNKEGENQGGCITLDFRWSLAWGRSKWLCFPGAFLGTPKLGGIKRAANPRTCGWSSKVAT